MCSVVYAWSLEHAGDQHSTHSVDHIQQTVSIPRSGRTVGVASRSPKTTHGERWMVGWVREVPPPRTFRPLDPATSFPERDWARLSVDADDAGAGDTWAAASGAHINKGTAAERLRERVTPWVCTPDPRFWSFYCGLNALYVPIAWIEDPRLFWRR